MGTIIAVRGIENTSEPFRWKLVRMSEALSVHPDFVATVMSFETKGTFDPAQPNLAGSGAMGLIQFMPDTARGLHTTTEALAQMTAEDQLDYVHAYFLPFVGRLRTLSDVYLAVLNPSMMGKSLDTVVWREGVDGKKYSQNAGFDKPYKGYITVGDITAAVRGLYNAGLARGRVEVPDNPPPDWVVSFPAPLPSGQQRGLS